MNQHLTAVPDEPEMSDSDVARLISADPERRDWDPEASAANPMLPLYSYEDMMALPDPEWLIHGILPYREFCTVIGEPKLGKTFVVLSLALCVATGTPWFGHKVRTGKVVYQAGEGHSGIKLRIEAWLAKHPDADRGLLARNFRVVPKAVRLLQEDDATALINTAVALEADLVITDTWARAMLGGEENSALDTGKAISVCEKVRDRAGATVIAVHHSTKGGGAARGSGALLGAVSTQLTLVEGETSKMVLKCLAQKESAQFRDMAFDLVPSARSVVIDTPRELRFERQDLGPVPATPPAATGGFGGSASAARPWQASNNPNRPF